jgi:low temperature requirement protein LtrA
LSLSAYTYSHVPTIAGIVAVAADVLIGAHPGVQRTLASAALTLGGTRLFVAAQAFFK